MKLARIIERVTLTPWVITPAGYQSIIAVLESKLAGAKLDTGSLKDFDNPGLDYVVDRNGIAQIMLSGIFAQRISMMEKVCGGADYLDIEGVTNAAIEDGARGLLYHFDSPGGTSAGCPEAANVIAGVDIPKVAFTDSVMCSGAYWLASSCDYLVATESAAVGSIGCIVPWVDQSKRFEAAGLSFEPIVSEDSELKDAFYGPSLTKEQRAHFQESVNQIGAAFKSHVSQFRNLNYGDLQAGAYSGAKAKSSHLVDKVGNYADAYGKLLRLVDKANSTK